MFDEELAVAKKVAKKAGAYLLKRRNICIDSEAGKDIKLSSDKQSERIILGGLSEFGYSIISEEYGFCDKGTELCWIVDPLDGTMNYLKGLDDLTCVSIALWKGNEPVLGVVYRYKSDEMFTGIVGTGAFLNDRELCCSNVIDVSQAVLGTGFPVSRNFDDESLREFIYDSQIYKKVRMFGTAALMCVYVSCGRIDVYKEENVKLWDIAAALAIVKAAGGYYKIEFRDKYKCICKCYANASLMMMDIKQ